MGCGSSTSVAPDERPTLKKAADRSKQGSRQLNRNASQLGSKRVINSFVVARTTMRKRESASGNLSVEAEGLGGKALEELKVIQEDKSFRHPRTAKSKSAETNFKMPCGVIQMPEPMLKDTDTLTLQTEVLPQDIETNKQKLGSIKNDTVLQGAKWLRENLCMTHITTAQLCSAGAVTALVKLLQRENNEMLHEALWVLANVCAGPHEECELVVNEGAVPTLVLLLASANDEDVLQKTMWTLGNIAADCGEYQRAVVEGGALPPLLQVMRNSIKQTGLMRQATWLLSNMLRPEPCSDVLLEAVPVLELLLGAMEDGECLTQMCWALSYLSEREDGVEQISKRNALLRTLAYLVNQGKNPVMPALHVLGNSCSSSAACTNVVAAGGISALLCHLKRTQLPFVKKECMWALSNIAISGSDNIKRLLEDNVFKEGIQTMREWHSHTGLLRECTYLLANPWSQDAKISEELALKLLEQGIVEELVGLLDPETPSSVLLIAIDGLQDLVKRGQRIMMWQAKQNPGQPPGNPVIQVLSRVDASAKLQGIARHENEDVKMKVNGLVNVLQFM